MDKNRLLIIQSNHSFCVEDYLADLSTDSRLLYNSKPSYVKGHEFLASNEFDWHKSLFPPIKTSAVIGVGSNSLWDLAVQNQAESIVFADVSPWPLIAQAYIMGPLLRVAKSVNEFLALVSGMPSKDALSLSLTEVFELAKTFTLSPLSLQKPKVMELLTELAGYEEISNFELQFLTTFFRPRLGDNLHRSSGYGPFYELQSPNSANLTYYLEQRYNPKHNAHASSALSSEENFQAVRNIFLNRKSYYAWTDLVDIDFYKSVLSHTDLRETEGLSISLSNVFSCGYYNELSEESYTKLINQLKKIMGSKNIFIYKTEGRKAPYQYCRKSLLY